MECAYLSNDKNYTIFKYGPYTIRFKAPYSLTGTLYFHQRMGPWLPGSHGQVQA